MGDERHAAIPADIRLSGLIHVENGSRENRSLGEDCRLKMRRVEIRLHDARRRGALEENGKTGPAGQNVAERDIERRNLVSIAAPASTWSSVRSREVSKALLTSSHDHLSPLVAGGCVRFD